MIGAAPVTLVMTSTPNSYEHCSDVFSTDSLNCHSDTIMDATNTMETDVAITVKSGQDLVSDSPLINRPVCPVYLVCQIYVLFRDV